MADQRDMLEQAAYINQNTALTVAELRMIEPLLVIANVLLAFILWRVW